ncbi:MAG: PIN domain-containing protein [Thermoleophilia bacterium]|nr:PIN domain-containing protein [Thermoleophilia bacterium]
MADRRLVLDSDVFIDHLRGARSIDVFRGTDLVHSVMTRVELFAGNDPDHVIRELLSGSVEVVLDARLAQMAGAIRRATRLAVPDAIIAATAVVAGRTLVTRNIRHFERVPELDVASPDEFR